MRTHTPPLAPATGHELPPERPDPGASISCLGRTCLQWRADGELFDDDRDLVLQRLRLVDPQVTIPLDAQGEAGLRA